MPREAAARLSVAETAAVSDAEPLCRETTIPYRERLDAGHSCVSKSLRQAYFVMFKPMITN